MDGGNLVVAPILVLRVLCWAIVFKFSNLVLGALSSSAIILLRRKTGCFTLFIMRSVSLTQRAVGRSAVSSCGISWLYSREERISLLAIQIASRFFNKSSKMLYTLH